MAKSDQIKQKLDEAGIRYWAGDNISQVLQEGDKQELIEELTGKFNGVDSLIIDRKTDPIVLILADV